MVQPTFISGNVYLDVFFLPNTASRKMEAGILANHKPGEYRWYGAMQREEQDEQGRLLYRFGDAAQSI